MSVPGGLTGHGAPGHYKLANLWQRRGHPERAARGYEAALQSDPGFAPAYLELAELLRREGRPHEVKALYQRASAARPDDTALCRRLLALAGEGDGARPEHKPTPARPVGDPRAPHVVIHSDCHGLYGAGRFNHLLACGLAAAGFRVTCVQPRSDDPLATERLRLGIGGVELPEPGGTVAGARELFASLRPSVILFSDGSERSDHAAKQAAAELNIPYVAIAHLPGAGSELRHPSSVLPWPALYQRARAVVAVSRTSLDSLDPAANFPRVPARVIYNGVPATFFEPPRPHARRQARRDLGVADGAVLVLTTARMELSKGYQYQVAAMRRLRETAAWPRLQFAWAGAGTCEARLRAAVAEAGVSDRVRFLGERPDTLHLLDAADVFLLPSECEGMSVSVLEAMAKGLPVICSAVGGMAEALGATGQLLPPPRPEAGPAVALLARALDDWAARPDLREAVGRECCRRARTLFSPRRMIDDYLDLIRSVQA